MKNFDPEVIEPNPWFLPMLPEFEEEAWDGNEDAPEQSYEVVMKAIRSVSPKVRQKAFARGIEAEDLVRAAQAILENPGDPAKAFQEALA